MTFVLGVSLISSSAFALGGYNFYQDANSVDRKQAAYWDESPALKSTPKTAKAKLHSVATGPKCDLAAMGEPCMLENPPAVKDKDQCFDPNKLVCINKQVFYRNPDGKRVYAGVRQYYYSKSQPQYSTVFVHVDKDPLNLVRKVFINELYPLRGQPNENVYALSQRMSHPEKAAVSLVISNPKDRYFLALNAYQDRGSDEAAKAKAISDRAKLICNRFYYGDVKEQKVVRIDRGAIDLWNPELEHPGAQASADHERCIAHHGCPQYFQSLTCENAISKRPDNEKDASQVVDNFLPSLEADSDGAANQTGNDDAGTAQ